MFVRENRLKKCESREGGEKGEECNGKKLT